ncbi:hypothetical protein [Nocardia asiatica]|uniref:hypothetical protein n=1 Tax=Nocardia asiatica TaxID=209252 RepID=UPI003EE38310
MSTDDLEVARVFLERLGIHPQELLRLTTHDKRLPTFAEYVPQVSAAVSAGARRTYLPYWRQLTVAGRDVGDAVAEVVS